MSLTKAIRFRYLISQLTPVERVQFVRKLLDSHVDIMLKSLFDYIVTSQQSQQIDWIDDINGSLSTIIQTRKEKRKQVSAQYIKLDQFPKVIIGHTASFLQQTDYIHFSLSNRHIYLGCNSPNLLQKLDLLHVNNYASIKLPSFTSINKLKINVSTLIESEPYINFDSPIFHNVSELTLHAQKKHDSIPQFLKRSIVNLDGVTALKCMNFGSIPSSNDMEKDNFLDLLRRVPNLQQLSVENLSLTDDVTAKEIADLCPDLSGLSVYGGCRILNDDLIGILGHKLKFLGFLQYEDNNFNFDNVDFKRLEQLYMMRPSNQSFNGIMKSASNLNKIYIKPMNNNIQLMTNQDIKNAITKVMMKCQHLQYLFIAANLANLSSIFDGIEYGLFKTKNRQRQSLQISVSHFIKRGTINASDSFEANGDFILNITRIITSLETSPLNDFMFVWNLKYSVKDDELNQIFMDLQKISTHANVTRHNKTFVISNENCKINGHNDIQEHILFPKKHSVRF